MRKDLVFSLFILLFIFFAIASQSIIGVKLQELRFGILRDQLMNYELSSQTLRERLKQMFISKDDYLQEVKVNILESGIMNSETEGIELEMKWQDRFGLAVINGVRFMNFKPFLELEEQQKTIIRLQFAFYMERTRKFSIASKKYEELDEILDGSLADEQAFTLLHQGYCLVMMGDRDLAYVKLTKVTDLFPGTHYAENALLLLEFLKEGEKLKISLTDKTKKPEAIAYALFQSGDYEGTLKSLEALPNLSNDQEYTKARSLEELGKTSNAVHEYIQLVKQHKNKDIAIKANRRLLLIGNFYQENKSLVEYAKLEANKLGDAKAASQIQEGKSLVLKPIIIEKILKAETSDINSNEAKELAEIRNNLKEYLEEAKVENRKLLSVVKEESIPIVAEEMAMLLDKKVETTEIPPLTLQKKITLEIKPANLKLQVRMRDGRNVLCDKLTSDSNLAKLTLGAFVLEIPLVMISSIQTSRQQQAHSFSIEKNNGEIVEVKGLTRTQEGVWVSNPKLVEEIKDSDMKEIRVRK